MYAASYIVAYDYGTIVMNLRQETLITRVLNQIDIWQKIIKTKQASPVAMIGKQRPCLNDMRLLR